VQEAPPSVFSGNCWGGGVAIQALAVDWHGPYALHEAAQKCRSANMSDGVYVAFGRNWLFGWWPLWWEARWVLKAGRPSLTTRPAAYPLQYIGKSYRLERRLNHRAHEKLKYLDPKRTVIWVGTPVSEFDRTQRDGPDKDGHLFVVTALEETLIFALKPRMNFDEVEATSAEECVAWCRHESAELPAMARRQARRLPEVVRHKPKKWLVLEFSNGRSPTLIRVDASKRLGHPVASLQLWLASLQHGIIRPWRRLHARVSGRHGFGRRHANAPAFSASILNAGEIPSL